MLTGLKKQEESSQNHVRELDIVQRSREMFVWPIYAGVKFHDEQHYIFTPKFFCFFSSNWTEILCHFNLSLQLTFYSVSSCIKDQNQYDGNFNNILYNIVRECMN